MLNIVWLKGSSDCWAFIYLTSVCVVVHERMVVRNVLDMIWFV